MSVVTASELILMSEYVGTYAVGKSLRGRNALQSVAVD